MAKKTSAPITRSQTLSIALEVKGVTSLIQNCFNQKAIEQMLRKHMGLPTEQEKKVPAECVERAIIRNEAGAVSIPPTAFKQAILSAAGQVKGLTKTKIRASLFIEGGSVPITYSRMVPRMDMTRLSGMGRTPDVRFRPEFEDWSARMIILFSDQLPVRTVIDLLQRAGNVGVGEWRPERNGTFGTFEVSQTFADSKQISAIRKACRPAIKRLVIPEWAMNVELSDEILKKVASSNETNEDDE
jgi:hypothetical protein